MKKWTVVIEFTDENDNPSKEHVEGILFCALQRELENERHIKYRIMETIPAPYGPQHPGGVFISEMKCICRKGSAFVNPRCRAGAHHP